MLVFKYRVVYCGQNHVPVKFVNVPVNLNHVPVNLKMELRMDYFFSISCLL